MDTQREDVENQMKQKLMLEREVTEKDKADVKQQRENLERLIEMMTKGKVELELIWSNIQEQLNLLQQHKEEQAEFIKDKGLKRDVLRKMWKDTKVEREEIDQMKRRGHEMRNNMEKRLKVINSIFKRSWTHRGKEPLEKMTLEQGQLSYQRECETEQKTFDDKYTELELLKAQMLSEIQKLCVKDKDGGKLKTSDKAMQTVQVDTTTEDDIVQVTEQAETTSAKINQDQIRVKGSEAPSDGSSRLLRQLRHFCYCCCHPCCDCCQQMFQDET
ncbi:hypothetical protein LDENG_00128530 [Lucifuga dentata]|nr:hypothetical protein LDENG_00128530 [Lucifuga dentata]